MGVVNSAAEGIATKHTKDTERNHGTFAVRAAGRVIMRAPELDGVVGLGETMAVCASESKAAIGAVVRPEVVGGDRRVSPPRRWVSPDPTRRTEDRSALP